MSSFYSAIQCVGLENSFDEAIKKLEIRKIERQPLGSWMNVHLFRDLIEIKKKIVGSGEVRIKVHAASLNFYDLLMLVGKYQYKPELPFTMVNPSYFL